MIKRIFATCRLLPYTMEAGALPDLYKIFFDLLTLVSSYHKTDKTSSKVLLSLVDLFFRIIK